MAEIDLRIRTWENMRDWFRRDLIQRGAIKQGQRITTFTVFRNPVNVFMLLLRLNELSRNGRMALPLRFIVRALFRRQSVKLGFSIPPNVFGPGLAIVHYGPIVVNGNVRVGENCRIHVCVNIGGGGALTTPEVARDGSPRIGSNVYIAPGSKIYGPVKIADGTAIGANAVVNSSFEEPGVTIAGIPARVISRRGSRGMILGVPA